MSMSVLFGATERVAKWDYNYVRVNAQIGLHCWLALVSNCTIWLKNEGLFWVIADLVV